MSKKDLIISGVARCFTRTNNKLNRLEKRAVNFGTGEKLFASELHVIEAVGKKQTNTVTALCSQFGVTKGAVSQIISKLEKKGCVLKERNREDGKEIDISLTEKGWEAFKFHEDLHKEMDKELFEFIKTIPENRLSDFLELLVHIEKYVDRFLAK
jgi:DNA-binding MarR family transcriptional regulator